MIGSGAAGSVFASYLNKGGAELWLVDRYKAHMDKVAQSGMAFVTPSGEELLTGFRTAYSAENIGGFSLTSSHCFTGRACVFCIKIPPYYAAFRQCRI